MDETNIKQNIDTDAIPVMPQNPFLSWEALDPVLSQLLSQPSDGLAQATRPDFMHNSHSPVLWSDDNWDQLETNRSDIFDMSTLVEQFDYDRFLVDGYAVLERVMTPEAIHEWTTALKYGQQLNDRLLLSDWRQIDWQALGRTPPTESLTADEINHALGGSQILPQSDDRAGVKTLRQHSVLAEYFPAGHVSFLMNVLTHPQMLQLQQMCLRTDRIYFDHNQLLTRTAGYAGGAWHSHQIGGGVDDQGVTSVLEYQLQPNLNLTLCYPQGFEAANDGGLKLIRGSHLFRDPTGCRASNDDRMRKGWLAKRLHPVTEQLLKIEHLSLPPGSVVCCLSHAAHAVAAKGLNKDTRWCSIYCYKKADDRSGYVLPAHSVPPIWAMKAKRGELPSVLGQLFRSSFDQTLTGGRTTAYCV
ncbi:MAG: hypothetical protein QGH37_03000 [Candidatus Poribacteria bacterium]|nr:hypothetical protein [Candidatus Poribacteria bacterium]MDP6998109.1 hypothetical protein [Candidatus Poribacteria bacterium]